MGEAGRELPLELSGELERREHQTIKCIICAEAVRNGFRNEWRRHTGARNERPTSEAKQLRVWARNTKNAKPLAKRNN